MISLDARLRSVYDAVGTCDCIADIGSDHALLPIALLQSGKVNRAIACDINNGPLERSRKNALKFGVKNIDFYHSDGFDSINDVCFDKAAICGMGGILIADIIERGGDKAHCGLILQPMTAAAELRAYLWDNGYPIDNEFFTVDNNKVYVVITCHYTGEKVSYTYSDLYLGKIRPVIPEYKAFCRKVGSQAKKRLNGIIHKGLPADELIQLISDSVLLD